MNSRIKQYFQLQDFPFEQTPNLRYFCNIGSYNDVIEAVLNSLEKGEPIIKIIGEVGTGKTLLCRKLIAALDEKKSVTLYIHNPFIKTETLLRLIADELEVTHSASDLEYHLSKNITQKLLDHYEANTRVVLFVDEAQTLSDEALEALRLLTNLESESRKLIHIVFLAQPELEERLAQKKLRQLKQRIGFSFTLSALKSHQIEPYLKRRLISAGHAHGDLFLPEARDILFEESAGIPRVINIIAFKALLASYVQGKAVVDKESMQMAVRDAKDAIDSNVKKRRFLSSSDGLLMLFFVLAIIAVFFFFLLIR